MSPFIGPWLKRRNYPANRTDFLDGSCRLSFYISKKIFQAELNQSRCYGRLSDDAEVRRPPCCARVGELWMIEGIVKFHPQLELCILPKASHLGGFSY